ncbi:MAG: calcium/sodium antiporter [Nanoarchaeota archaeon]|nr:calcium/sodium antiporter [Nanoarchaeota archaeon]
MIIELILFIIGLALLVKGSDYFVKSAASIAKNLGVSGFIIGLTVVAIGTSIPELASAIFASIKQESGIIIGNVVGSNIANVGLIIGITATLYIIKGKKNMIKKDGLIMLIVVGLFLLAALNQNISRIEAGLLLVIYLLYLLFTFQTRVKLKGKFHLRAFINYILKFQYLQIIKNGFRKKKNQKKIIRKLLIKDSIILIISGFFIVLGAKYLVTEAIFFANFFNIPQTLIAISIMSIGTTLPELSVSLTAAKKGFGNIALGNILGSIIANIGLIIGISGLIHPLSLIKESVYYAIPFMIFMSLLLVIFIKTEWKLTKIEGLILLALYFLFISSLFFFTII